MFMLSVPGQRTIRVKVIEWDVYETAIPGYLKVQATNPDRKVYVVSKDNLLPVTPGLK